MTTPINNNFTVKDVLNAGKDLAIGALTIVATVALVAKPIFATLGTPAVATKVGAALGLGLLGGPVGWAIFGTVALVGAVYFGHKLYQTLKSTEKDPYSAENVNGTTEAENRILMKQGLVNFQNTYTQFTYFGT
jgi:hypothetical protein